MGAAGNELTEAPDLQLAGAPTATLGGPNPALERRRALERASADTRVLGGGRTVFHPENSRVFRALLVGALRLTGLLERGRRNAMDIQLRRNPVLLQQLPRAFEGYTLLHLSDLHLDSRPDFAARLAEAVTGLDYDACVLTGDYRFRTDGDSGPALQGLSLLRQALRGPAYAVLGNHDGSEMIDAMQGMGYEMLYNRSVPLRRDGELIFLAGVDDPHFFQTDDLDAALRAVPRNAVCLLLAHSPEIYLSAASAEVDYLFCGHTHGGQIALPGGRVLYANARCPVELVSGPWRWQGLAGYTTAGAGSSVLHVRYNCPPEIVLHALQRPCQAQAEHE